ncbi:hypothetical protein [Halorubrum sp. Boch-26]|uniref:hypothetical protein n=1 Tax=Halorubrum sp. Boch-26 TaxID=2994426 RepID=UPI0024695E97|nr:hypothetical protein [Halorubrum sp. Boch-26]
MEPEAGDGPSDGADDADGDTVDTTDTRGTGSPLADRWTALDRGWQALALGLGIVAAHLAGQAAGLF